MKFPLPLALALTLLALPPATAPAESPSPPPIGITDEQAQASGLADAATAAQFYRRATAAILADDIAAVATLVRYPLLYGNDDNRKTRQTPHNIVTPTALRADYDKIFTPTVKRVLACRDAADFFANSEGVMVGGGTFWFSLAYIGDPDTPLPLDELKNPQYWQPRIIAVYDGAHARRDADRCEARRTAAAAQ